MARSTLLLTLTLALAACSSGPFFGDGGFAVAELTRTPGLGFCPSSGQAILARLEASAGSATIKGTLAAFGDRTKDVCDQRYHGAECLIAKPFGPRSLTAAELTTLKSKIGAVPEPLCEVDKGLACDPCLVDRLVLDGREASSTCCGKLNQDFATAFLDLLAAIDALAKASL